MRPYRNINEIQLARFGAIREWDANLVRSLPLPSPLLWVYAHKEKNTHSDNCIKTITLLRIEDDLLKTDFGTYSLTTGKAIRACDGTQSMVDCRGQLYMRTSRN